MPVIVGCHSNIQKSDRKNVLKQIVKQVRNICRDALHSLYKMCEGRGVGWNGGGGGDRRGFQIKGKGTRINLKITNF